MDNLKFPEVNITLQSMAAIDLPTLDFEIFAVTVSIDLMMDGEFYYT